MAQKSWPGVPVMGASIMSLSMTSMLRINSWANVGLAFVPSLFS
jgi:hypothetical protein